MYTKSNVNSTLPEPVRPDNIPANAQWLAGEGAGSWYALSSYKNAYLMQRFSDEGKPECTGIFKPENDSAFNINESYQFTYMSHCNLITLVQKGVKFQMSLIERQ